MLLEAGKVCGVMWWGEIVGTMVAHQAACTMFGLHRYRPFSCIQVRNNQFLYFIALLLAR
jgi:hypothetical protein